MSAIHLKWHPLINVNFDFASEAKRYKMQKFNQRNLFPNLQYFIPKSSFILIGIKADPDTFFQYGYSCNPGLSDNN